MKERGREGAKKEKGKEKGKGKSTRKGKGREGERERKEEKGWKIDLTKVKKKTKERFNKNQFLLS